MPQVKVANTRLTYVTLVLKVLIVIYVVVFARATAIALMELDYLQLFMCLFTIICALKYRSGFIDSLNFVAFFDAFGDEATEIYNAHNGIRVNGLDADSGRLVPYLLDKVGLRYWWCVLGLLNQRPEYAVLDTGSQYNIMSAKYADWHNLKIDGPRQSFTLANSTLVTSEGYVEVDWMFEGEHTKVYRLKFHVIKGLCMNLLIGNDTLRETETLSRQFNRVRRMLLSTQRLISPIMFLKPPGSSCQLLLHGVLSKRIAVQALPDTGAAKNIMDADWARLNGFRVQSGEGEGTFLLFADKSVQRTLGTVKTQWTFQDGSTKTITFHILHNCAGNVILGEEFLYKHKVFPEHSESIVYVESTRGLSGLCHFGLFSQAKRTGRTGFLGKRREVPISPGSSRRDVAILDRAELHRQDQWDAAFACGRSANRMESEAEDKRRKDHEVWRVSKIQQIQMAERLRFPGLSTLDPGQTTGWN